MMIEINDKIYECLKEYGEADTPSLYDIHQNIDHKSPRTKSSPAEVITAAARSHFIEQIRNVEQAMNKMKTKIKVNEIMAEEEETEEERAAARMRIGKYTEQMSFFQRRREDIEDLIERKLNPGIIEMNPIFKGYLKTRE